MPRNKDSKKSKKSSALKDPVTSSAGQCENVRPPNPEESNLVACNPFDDTPKPPVSMPMRMVHPGFPGQPMGRLQPGAPMNVGYSGWSPKAEMQGLRPGYGNFNMAPHPFPSNAMHGVMRSPNYHTHPNVASGHNGFGLSRGVPYGLPFRHTQRMISNGYRPGMPTGPMVSDGMLEPQGMIGGPVVTGPGHMTSLTRAPGSMVPTQQMLRRTSTGSAKSTLLPTERKSPKTSENSSSSSSSKSKKKSEKKGAQENRSKNAEPEKPVNNGVDQSLSSGNATPNSATVAAPKQCKSCSNDINSCTDESIQCRASCNLWYHKACTGLSDNAFKFLTTEDYALWACDTCIQTKEINAIRPKSMNTPLSAGA